MYSQRIVTLKLILANIKFQYQRGKWMHKSNPPGSDQVIKIYRRTTLSEKQLKERCDEEVNVFTDEYSDQSSEEIEEEQTNLPPLQTILN